MPDAVVCRKIIGAFVSSLVMANKRLQVWYGPISQKYVSGLCPGSQNMVYPVLFFFRTGQFMFFNDFIFIIQYRRYCYETSLALAIHGQLINIITGLFFHKKKIFFLENMQVLPGFFINTFVMNIHFGR